MDGAWQGIHLAAAESKRHRIVLDPMSLPEFPDLKIVATAV